MKNSSPGGEDGALKNIFEDEISQAICRTAALRIKYPTVNTWLIIKTDARLCRHFYKYLIAEIGFEKRPKLLERGRTK